MAFSTGKPSILQDLRAEFKDTDLVAYYLGVYEIPCCINSPVRKDNRPSFGLYSNDGININWFDFATKERGDIYNLLSLMWNCNLQEVLKRLRRDKDNFKSGTLIKNREVCKIETIATRHKTTDLQCKVREWRPYDLDYWASYGVPLEWLKYAEVYPISHKIIVNKNSRYVFGADKLAYAFVEHKEGKVTLKIYQPLNKEGYKWSNKHDRSVISLWTKIPERGDRVIICSSLKDALCLWANTGIPAIAVQGEAYNISETAINELKRRYKQVYILFDNDDAGLKDGEKLAHLTGFTNIVLPPFTGGKDISDLYKAVGKNEFIKIINCILKTTAFNN
jgi:hypothetical protein